MDKIDKALSIGDWTRKNAHLRNIAGILADKCGLTSSAIYLYIKASDTCARDIRVIGSVDNPEIFEIKRLSKW